MKRAAEKAAFLLARDFGELENLQSSRRGFSGFVESANARSYDRIVKDLSKARPDFSLLNEGGSGSVWIVGPICGIANFARGIPQFAMSIAIMEDGIVTAGLTLDPLRGDCFNSTLGGGAFLGNRNRLRVSGREELRDSIVAVDDISPHVCGMMSEGKARLRSSGSVALDIAYLSAGKYDAVVSNKVNMRDIASGLILIREAGGFFELVPSTDGTYGIIAASSSKLMKHVSTLIKPNA
jgi:myo-inositol-1(or 4)-monophosphatase